MLSFRWAVRDADDDPEIRSLQGSNRDPNFPMEVEVLSLSVARMLQEAEGDFLKPEFSRLKQ
jgi:hypothetical protein